MSERSPFETPGPKSEWAKETNKKNTGFNLNTSNLNDPKKSGNNWDMSSFETKTIKYNSKTEHFNPNGTLGNRAYENRMKADKLTYEKKVAEIEAAKLRIEKIKKEKEQKIAEAKLEQEKLRQELEIKKAEDLAEQKRVEEEKQREIEKNKETERKRKRQEKISLKEENTENIEKEFSKNMEKYDNLNKEKKEEDINWRSKIKNFFIDLMNAEKEGQKKADIERVAHNKKIKEEKLKIKKENPDKTEQEQKNILLKNINKRNAPIPEKKDLISYKKRFSVPLEKIGDMTQCSKTARLNLEMLGVKNVKRGDSAINSMKLYGNEKNYANSLTKLPNGTNVMDLFIDTSSKYEHRAAAFLENGNWFVYDPYTRLKSNIVNPNLPIPLSEYSASKKIMGAFAHSI